MKLSDEQIQEMVKPFIKQVHWEYEWDVVGFARAIERALLDSSHLIAPVGQTVPGDALSEGDLAAINRTADEYEQLMEQWKEARAGSQETANLHATFKARERTLGKLAEDGLFTRIRAALSARHGAGTDRPRPDEKESASPSPPVDAQWVEKALELALDYGVDSLRVGSYERADSILNGGRYSYKTIDLRDKRKASSEALRTHLNTALSGETP